jgi:phenylalanyl-tRNA synthetase beta chain
MFFWRRSIWSKLHDARAAESNFFAPLGKYPAVERDFSFVFADEVEFEAMRRAVMGLRLDALREFKPVEIFRGGSIGRGNIRFCCGRGCSRMKGRCAMSRLRSGRGKIVAALQGLGGVQRA